MNTDSDNKNDRDPVFDRLPEKVKREFLEKRRKEEAQGIEYQAGLKKKRIAVAAVGWLEATLGVFGVLVLFVATGALLAVWARETETGSSRY